MDLITTPMRADDEALILSLAQLRMRVRRVAEAALRDEDYANLRHAADHGEGLRDASAAIERVVAWLVEIEGVLPTPEAAGPETSAPAEPITAQPVVAETAPSESLPPGPLPSGSVAESKAVAVPAPPVSAQAPEPPIDVVRPVVAAPAAAAPAPAPAPDPAAARAARRARGKAAESEFRTWSDRVTKTETGKDEASFAAWKAAACGLQAIRADFADLNWADLALDEIQRMQSASGVWPEQEFYGLNLHRNESPRAWRRLAEIYGHAATAFRLIERANGDLEPGVRQDLGGFVAGVVGAWDRAMESLIGKAFDQQMIRLRDRVAAIAPGVRIERASTDEQLDRQVHRLQSLANTAELVVGKIGKTERKRLALENLAAVVAEPNHPEFEARLVAALQRALAEGAAASSEQIRNAALPFRALLEGHDDLKAVRTQLDKFMTTSRIPLDRLPEAEVVESEETVRMREAVQALMAGKRVLIVGGNKVHQDKRAELQAALGCDEIEWPDSEDHTHVATFDAPMRRADVVMMIVRWSRHAYKGVLDDAKRLGKSTVQVVSGIGANRVVFDVYEQLIGNLTPPAPEGGAGPVRTQNGR